MSEEELTLEEVVAKKKSFKLGDEMVVLDPSKLEFTEATLDSFQEKEAIWYDYFGQKLADAEYLLQVREHEYEVKYSEKYAEYKELGGTDKLCEANAKSNSEVEEARKQILEAKQRVRSLQWHLKAMDKAHDNAQSRGHMIRKEMDKLHHGVSYNSSSIMDSDDLERMMKEATE